MPQQSEGIFGDQNNQARAVCACQKSFLGEWEQRGGEDDGFPVKGEPVNRSKEL